MKKQTNIRADEELMDRVSELAKRERRSFAVMLQILLEEALNQRLVEKLDAK